MHKVKLKIFSFFQKCRNFLVIFGLTLCIFVFIFSFPASAIQIVPQQADEGLRIYDFQGNLLQLVQPYETGYTIKYGWWYDNVVGGGNVPGDRQLRCYWFLPSNYVNYTGTLTCKFYFSTSVGGDLSGQTCYLVTNGDTYNNPVSVGTEVYEGLSMTTYSYNVSLTLMSNRIGMFRNVYAGYQGSGQNPLYIAAEFNFEGTPPPQSSAESNTYPRPSGSTVSEFDNLESGIMEDSSDSINEGYTWLTAFNNILTDWNLSSLSAVTKFFNYLTGSQIMNGHLYSTFDYFMRPIYISMSFMVLPLILGLALRFFRNKPGK